MYNMNSNTVVIVIIIIIITIFIIAYCDNSVEHMGPANSQRFLITFEIKWGTPGNEEMINYPDDPHTGNMCLVVHNNKYSMFKLGEFASKGVDESASYGTNDTLIKEITNNGNYLTYYTAPILYTPGATQFDITVNDDYPYFSFMTMIAPSPNWFVGASNVDLIDIGNIMDYQNYMTIPIYAYDTGTDYGLEFKTLPKHPRGNNTKPISLLMNDTIFANDQRVVPPFAYLHIQKIN